MFKKKPAIKPLAPLRSSDRRKLADQIINDFKLDLDTPAQNEQTPEQKAEATAARTSMRNFLLPDNLQSARFTTTHGPELKTANGTVYVGSRDGEESRILWFQIDGRMYPTVYTLWRNPDLVPLLHTPGVVVKKLQGGADLMTPGLAGGPPFPPNAKKGAIVAVASTDSPSVPIAVGVCNIDVGALDKVQGAKGHAVDNMHWARDELWTYSTGSRPGQEPPEQIDGWVKVLEARGVAQKVQEMSLDAGDEDGGISLENGNGEDHTANGHDEGLSKEAEPAIPFTQKEVDDAFRKAFFYGLYHHKTTNPHQKNHGLVFPLTQSFTMSNLVQPFLPASTPEQSQQLQIKKTSWKNIKRFVKSFDKEKVIKTKDQDGNETVILDIDFDDVAIVNFKPYRLPKKETVGGISQGRGELATDKIDTGDDSVGQKLQVVSYYRPTSKLQPVFDAGSPNKALFTPPEVRVLVTAYIEQQQLVQENNKRLVKLDPTLANSVFDGSGSLDKEVLAKGTVPRDALIDRILHSMAGSYAIIRNGTDPGTTKAKSGAPPKVHITLETRSGNKTVTKVSGLEAYYINPRPLADELRKVCAGSTSVEPLAGAAKKTEKPVMEVLIQGPQRDALVKALEKRGVDKKWIEVLDKTKGKKR
ncbi:hypothetical protein DOTSEDRAFT_145652 [Dothistroma septosporum NZE10]|uniref:SUI1 domain-containing protein n=1 Tax=Dothistroma septosporum (strain NZE10 / CBS 128990) TaxID=675120 RepID=N1PV11_DOTSN|nr:hypothetical protein DOTSEDRAFT_145652 [Dothistroma septosporum NZE10]